MASSNQSVKVDLHSTDPSGSGDGKLPAVKVGPVLNPFNFAQRVSGILSPIKAASYFLVMKVVRVFIWKYTLVHGNRSTFPAVTGDQKCLIYTCAGEEEGTVGHDWSKYCAVHCVTLLDCSRYLQRYRDPTPSRYG